MQRKLWLALAGAAGGGSGGSPGGGGGDSSASGGSGAGAGGSSNPPGTVSPGVQRDSVPGADARTPGYDRTNPNVDDPDSKRGRGRKSGSGSTTQ